MYAWNKKGRSESVLVVQHVIITSDLSSQSTELPPGIVLKEPLFFVIGQCIALLMNYLSFNENFRIMKQSRVYIEKLNFTFYLKS